MKSRDKAESPTDTGLIKAPRKMELAPRAMWIVKHLEIELAVLQVNIEYVDIVSEYPAFHGHILGWSAGDLQKLVFLVGAFAGYFHHANSFTPVTPSEWKGQLPKSVVTRRLQKLLGPGATREWEKDMWDAVGIGLWKAGKF